MNKKISDKDKKDWENFISNTKKLEDKDQVFEKKKIHKIKTIDLHGLSLDQANKTVEKFVIDSYNSGISKLIIVTGKGLHSQNEQNPYVSKKYSILKYSIPEYVKNNNEIKKYIFDIKEADVKDGGSGAFYIYLKKK